MVQRGLSLSTSTQLSIARIWSNVKIAALVLSRWSTTFGTAKRPPPERAIYVTQLIMSLQQSRIQNGTALPHKKTVIFFLNF